MIIIAIITVARFGIQFVVLMALRMKTRIGVVNLGDKDLTIMSFVDYTTHIVYKL